MPKAVFRPQSVAAHFPLMIAFQGHPDKGTERVDMGLFLIKAYIGGWYDSKSFPTDVFSRWLDSPPGLREWKNPTFIAYVFVLLQIPFHGFELPDYKDFSFHSFRWKSEA